MLIHDSVSIVTGGSSGLGLGTVRALLQRGGRVANFDVAPRDGGATDGEVFFQIDVADEASVVRSVEAVVERFGAVHVCVNCAGIIRGAPVLGEAGVFPAALFRRTLDVNLTGSFLVLARAVEQMAKNAPGPDGERGVVVNTASIAALDAGSSVAYAASKGGVVSMTLTLARDLARHGIRVNAIAPGLMDTRMFDGLPDERRQGLIEQNVFPKRLGRPDEFGALVCHIVENGYLNASVIRFDAGARV